MWKLSGWVLDVFLFHFLNTTHIYNKTEIKVEFAETCLYELIVYGKERKKAVYINERTNMYLKEYLKAEKIIIRHYLSKQNRIAADENRIEISSGGLREGGVEMRIRIDSETL